MQSKIDLDNKRIYSFDIMRIVSICAVILLHISADYVKSEPNSSYGFIISNFLNSLSRFAVPIFFMISGALMLNENKKTDGKKIFRSTLSLFTLLIFWSVFYAVSYHLIKPLVFHENISISSFVNALLNGHYHMWYLFVLIGLYLITPLLRLFIKRENLPLITFYLILSIVLCFGASFINEFFNIFGLQKNILLDYISNYRIDGIYEYLVYYVLGWYILNVDVKFKHRICVYIFGIVGFISTFVCSQVFFDASYSENNYFYSNNSLNVFMYSVAIFMFLHWNLKKKGFVSNKFILTLSSLVFGVYIVHPIFLFVLKMVVAIIDYSFIKILIVFLCAVPLSFFFVYIASKIPFIKKLIRG